MKPPIWVFVDQWKNGRCKICVHGHIVKVNHIYIYGVAKPWFMATLESFTLINPVASFSSVLKKLDKLLEPKV